MDYEKEYREALERARKIHAEIVNNEVLGFPEQITDIFPELKESEDERIKKIITDSVFYQYGAGVEYKDALDYLDKLEIQKKKKDFRELYEDIAKSEWFKKAYEGKSLECGHEQRTEEWEYDNETDTQKAYMEGQTAGRQEVFDHPGAYGLEKIDNVFGFRIGDTVRLVDGDGRPHIIKYFEKIEGLHGPDFYRAIFEDNTASDHIIPGVEYPNGYFTCMQKIDEQKEQKPAEWSDTDNIGWDEAFACVTRAEKAAKNEEELQNAVTAEKWLKEIKFKYYVHPVKQEWSEVELEFRGEKVKVKRPFFRDDNGRGYSTTEQDDEVTWNALRAWAESHGYTPFELYPKEEWSEEDEKMSEGFMHKFEVCDLLTNKEIAWAKRRLNSLHPQPKQEWSEFDEDCLRRAIWYVENPAPSVVKDTNLALWLKSLPGRFNLQPKQEWSEEDKEMLLSAIEYVQTYPAHRQSVVNWLKSLRPSWKPTEEQLKALLNAEGYLREGDQFDSAKSIAQLYEQLKRL